MADNDTEREIERLMAGGLPGDSMSTVKAFPLKKRKIEPAQVQDSEQQPAIRVDLSRWRMKDYRTWENTSRSGDQDSINVIMATIIKAWPFEGDPSDPASYENLFPAEWTEALGAVATEAERIFRHESERVLSRSKVQSVG